MLQIIFINKTTTQGPFLNVRHLKTLGKYVKHLPLDFFPSAYTTKTFCDKYIDWFYFFIIMSIKEKENKTLPNSKEIV